jgi:predicted FMN-binding regulatory protein PaiB
MLPFCQCFARRVKGARAQSIRIADRSALAQRWNYIAVHAYGPVEFFWETERLLDVVTRLTNKHEGSRAKSWAASDAPADFIAAQLRGIVGVRIPVVRLRGQAQDEPEPPRSRSHRCCSGACGK